MRVTLSEDPNAWNDWGPDLPARSRLVTYERRPHPAQSDLWSVRPLRIPRIDVKPFIECIPDGHEVRGKWGGRLIALNTDGALEKPRITPIDPVLDAIPGGTWWLRIVVWELAAGHAMDWHQDRNRTAWGGVGLDKGEVASIHIPLETNPSVTIETPAMAVHADVGEAFYLDVTRPHRAVNRGETKRLELLVDVFATAELGLCLGAYADYL